mmetsp:Transcript_93999/g.130517  ORF Transcript_93999/g.130517 Transcript_93999/m.130517 type:complete len:194 (-) Transcript_93999:59-640(-)
MATAVQQLRVPPVQLKPAWFTSPEATVRLPTDIARDRLGGAPSKFYHYPDPVEGVGNISEETRKFLKACRTDVDEVRELLDAGAAVFQANTHGFTGLHVAAANLQMDTVQLLLERGHDVNVMEANGLTPLDYCVDAGFAAVETDGLEIKVNKSYQATVELLESYGGLCYEERCWLQAANQEKYAPNATSPKGS